MKIIFLFSFILLLFNGIVIAQTCGFKHLVDGKVSVNICVLKHFNWFVLNRLYKKQNKISA